MEASQWRKFCLVAVYLDLVLRIFSFIGFVIATGVAAVSHIPNLGFLMPFLFPIVYLLYWIVTDIVFFIVTTRTIVIFHSENNAFSLMSATNRWIRCQIWILGETIILCVVLFPLIGIVVLVVVRAGMLYIGVKRALELESGVGQPTMVGQFQQRF